MEKIKTLVIGIAGTGGTAVTVAFAELSKLNELTKILVMCFGIIPVAMSVYWMKRINEVKLKREEVELLKDEAEAQRAIINTQTATEQLCRYCLIKIGEPEESRCPVPKNNRPRNCWFNKEEKNERTPSQIQSQRVAL